MEAVPPKPKLTPPRPGRKPDLTPPPRGPVKTTSGAAGSRIILFIAFFVVALAAIGVVVLLPQQVAEQFTDALAELSPRKPESAAAPASGPSSEPLDQPAAAQDQEGSVHQPEAKREAEDLLRRILQRQATLEADGIEIWGRERRQSSYPDALERLSLANGHFDAERFVDAAGRYRETLSLLDQLQAGRSARLQAALRAGADALERGDDLAARNRFEIALALDPANAIAERGLERAQNLRHVLDLVRQGQDFEDSAKLDQARGAYAQAVALDGDYQPAQESLQRVEAAILTRDFQAALSKALKALQNKDFDTAQRALDRAEQLRPKAGEIEGIRQEVKAARQRAALERLRETATRHEKDEQWGKALQAYEQALKIDGQANFAVRGKARAAQFSQLTEQIEFYLADPERLQSPEPLTHARSVIEAAKSFPDAGDKLRQKRERLTGFVDSYSKPRTVVFQSDGKTDVTLHRVKHFGRFGELRMKLLPGLYTAVGTLAGYRDARVQFRVPPADEETIVVVRCEEQI